MHSIMARFVDAVRLWAETTGKKYKIPRKGTADYEDIMGVLEELKKVEAHDARPKKASKMSAPMASAAAPAPAPAPAPKMSKAEKALARAEAKFQAGRLRAIARDDAEMAARASAAAPAPAPAPAPKKKRKVRIVEEEKVDSLKTYLKGYSGPYQDYVDGRGEEVIYPTSDIKEIIRRVYANESFSDIQKQVGYDEEETASLIYDHFIGRNMDNPKAYSDDKKVMKIVRKFVRNDD